MSPSKVLVLRELQRQSGQKCADIAERLRITPKYTRKMLSELEKEGLAGKVCGCDRQRWYLAHELEEVRKRVKAEVREARRHRNIVYLLGWRESKRKSQSQSSIGAVPSVFALGAQ